MQPEQRIALARRIMRRLEVFPSFRPDRRPEMAEEYTAAIARMLTEFGSEATVEAVTKAIDQGGAFPPTPAQIRELIPPPERDAEVFQVIDARKFYSCRHGLFVSTPCAECKPAPLSWEEVLQEML